MFSVDIEVKDISSANAESSLVGPSPDLLSLQGKNFISTMYLLQYLIL